MRRLILFTTVLLAGTPVCAQTLQQRIDDYQRRQATQNAQQEVIESRQPTVEERMGYLLEVVALDDISADTAFNWWSQTTGIPLVINWEAMELAGVDREQRITLHLEYAPVGQTLSILMQLTSEFEPLIYETTPWYVRVMTKHEANSHPVLRVYDVSDLVVQVPNFTNAPTLNLEDALGSDLSGGGTTILEVGEEEDDLPTPDEQGQSLAELIRSTIEPDIWQENGGEYSSVRYFNKRLIVNAPMYVHRQIGMPAHDVTPLGAPAVSVPTREPARPRPANE